MDNAISILYNFFNLFFVCGVGRNPLHLVQHRIFGGGVRASSRDAFHRVSFLDKSFTYLRSNIACSAKHNNVSRGCQSRSLSRCQHEHRHEEHHGGGDQWQLHLLVRSGKRIHLGYFVGYRTFQGLMLYHSVRPMYAHDSCEHDREG